MSFDPWNPSPTDYLIQSIVYYWWLWLLAELLVVIGAANT
jgi:hypothetical protein